MSNDDESSSSSVVGEQEIDYKPNVLFDMRVNYSQDGLHDEAKKLHPMVLFKHWLEDARQNDKIVEPNAMCLSTCKENKPSSRMVLLKLFDDDGFVFFTSYSSRKGTHLEENPNACLNFWWIDRQVRIEGAVERVESQLSDDYFHKRPQQSQVGAWVSDQSQEIRSRQDLDDKEVNMTEKFLATDQDDARIVPRPSNWGGYRLKPTLMEFWKGRPSRLHDRLAYTLNESTGKWSAKRLQP